MRDKIITKQTQIQTLLKKNSRHSYVNKPLEDIQVDTVPNQDSIVISNESKFNYFLILCDKNLKIS